MTIVRIDSTIAKTIRAAGIDPVDLLKRMSGSGETYYLDDQDSDIADGLFFDFIDGVPTLHGGSLDLDPSAPKRHSCSLGPVFRGPWDDEMEFHRQRVDGMLAAHIQFGGTFPESDVVPLLGKPASSLTWGVPGTFDAVADRIIRDIRSFDYTNEGGGILYRVELTPSYELVEVDLPVG